MKKKIARIIICLILASSFCFGAAGCGDKSGFVVGTSEFVDSLNPFVAWSEVSLEVFNLIYDPLVRFDEEQKPTPALAKSWEVSDDDLSWTFDLAKANWHDGEKFTSEDVKFSYELFLTETGEGSYYGAYLSGIESIECPDESTVVIKTEKPKADMLYIPTPILPEHIWGEIGEKKLGDYKNKQPVGTGPYMFAEMQEGSLTLTVNGDYFGDPGTVESYSFVEYKNSDSMAQALKAGEIDGTTSLSAAQMGQLEEEEGIKVISGQIPGFTQLGFNLKEDGKGDPLLKDKEIRHAIECCIDKQKALEMAYSGQGEVGDTLLNSFSPYKWTPEGDTLRDYDIERAKEILDAAGYKDTDDNGIREDSSGNDLQFDLISIADNTEEVKMGQIIKAGCEEAGIGIKCVTMESGALSDKVYSFDYDMFIWGWGADVDPGSILNILTSNYDYAETGWINDEYDSLYKEQSTLIDFDERKAVVDKLQQIAYEEAPYVILVYDNYIQGVNSADWEGFVQIPENGCYFLNMTDFNYVNIKPAE